MVQDAVDHQPLHLDPKAEVFLLQLGVHGVLVLPLHALVLLAVTKVDGRRLVHVVLPLVVSEHHLAVKLELRERKEKKNKKTRRSEKGFSRRSSETPSFPTHLQLRDPGAVPIRHVGPLGEELPLRAPCQRGGIGGVGREVRRAGHRCGGGSVAPPPCEDLLDLPLHWRTLQGRRNTSVMTVCLKPKDRFLYFQSIGCELNTFEDETRDVRKQT